jgi:hypothetical protein
MYAGKALRPDTWIDGGGASYSVQYNVKDAATRTALCKEAMEACAAVINNSDENAKLLSSYEQVFKNVCQDVTNYYQSESLWEIPFNNGTRGQVLNLLGTKNNASTLLVNDGGGSHNSMITVVPSFAFDFDDADTRKFVTIVPFSWEKFNTSSDNASTDIPGYTPTNGVLWAKSSKISQLYLGKYRTEWMNRSTGGSDDGINLVIMRYADILLMFAEASIGSTGSYYDGDAVPANSTGLDGLTQFNRIRERAFGNSTHNLASLTLPDIQNERAFEFCGENIRKYDLMRWGVFANSLKNAASRIAALRDTTGEFSTRNPKVYFKYTENDALATSGKAYQITGIYGLSKNETGTPPGYVSSSDNNGWVGKNFYSGSSGIYLAASTYYLYSSSVEPYLENRQYWPLFTNNVSQSNGSLWNDYGY